MMCVQFVSAQQELVKHTHDATDKSNLRTALDAMKVHNQFIQLISTHSYPSMLGVDGPSQSNI